VARGWESKAIEAQQADRERRESVPAAPPVDPVRAARRRTLELARARAEADLKSASHAAHRAMLEATIRAIDEQLARDDSRTP